MNKLKSVALTTSLFLIGLEQAFAKATLADGTVVTPEMSASSAALVLGLMVGLVALISEHRRK
jgi:hypothetical protein